MTRDDIIRLAREADKYADKLEPCWINEYTEIRDQRFAALIKDHLISEGYRKCAEGQRTTQFCGQLEEAVAAEREKSLRLWMLLDDVDTIDDIAKSDNAVYRRLCRQTHQKRWAVMTGDEVDAALRARGEK